MSRSIRTAAIILALAPVAAWAAAGYWSSNGPYGGLTYDLAIDPATPSNLYATSRGGIFRSTDGGSSWARAQSGIVGSVSWDFPLVLDRERPQRLYTVNGSGRLYRSIDGALNWDAAGFVVPATESAWRLVDRPGPGSDGVFFLATQSGGASMPGPGLFRTSDDGATMSRLAGGLPSTGFVAVAIDPSDPDRMLAGTDYSYTLLPTDPSIAPLWRSVDGGNTWTAVVAGVGTGGSQRVEGIAFGAGSRVYAAVDCEILRSDDDGANWAVASSDCSNLASSLAAHPSLANTVYAAGNAGLRVSTDGGTTFAASPNSLTPNATYTDTLGRPIPAYVRRVVLDPTFPAPGAPLWAVTEGAGLFRSLDGGASYSNFDVNAGLAATNVRALAVHPSSAFTAATRPIYAGFGDSFYGSSAIWRSVNNGATWPTANTNLRGSNIRAIAFDDTTVGAPGQLTTPPAPGLATSTVYAVGRSALNGVGNGYRNSGIYKSSNGGANWNMLDGGLPRSGAPPNDFANVGTLRTVLLDPRSCANPPPGNARCGTDLGTTTGQSPLNTVWANATGRGALGWRVLRSLDGGASWTSRDSGIPLPSVDGQAITPIVLAMDPNDGNTLYASTTITFDTSLGTPPTLANGVFKTTDAGASWVPAIGPNGPGGLPRYAGSTDTALDALAMAVHPTVSGIVWVSTINFIDRSGSGIWKTVNGGTTWVSSSGGIPAGLDIRALIVDRSDPDTLYASGSGTESNPGAVYKSEDGGDTWRSISVGLPADSALALALDPVDARLLHAGTNLGVWDLTQVLDSDGDGASNNTESLSPSPGGGTGDGNGDGTPDLTQGDVGSSIVLDAPQWEGRLGRGTQALLAAAPQGGALSFTSDIQGTTCTQATDVQGVAAAAYGRDYLNGNSGRFYDYPRDLVRFEIPNCGAAVVDITFHNITTGGLPDFNDYQWSFRFRGPQVPGQDATIGWYDLGARAQKLSATKWRITLDANQFGSYRPVDDSILFMGGPAFSNDRVFRSGFE